MTHFKLTKQQQELWYAYQLNPKGDNYNVAVSYQAQGNLDKADNTAKLSYTKLRFITYLLYSDRRYTGRIGVRAFKCRLFELVKKILAMISLRSTVPLNKIKSFSPGIIGYFWDCLC